jgi:hypothetical protein
MLPAMAERARAWEAGSTPNQAMQRTAEGRH